MLKNKNHLLLLTVLQLACVQLLFSQSGIESNVLIQNFQNPPADARPTVWWRWYGRQISKLGITRDLEAMKKAGIGGFYHFQLKPGVPDIVNDSDNVLPDVATLSKEWWELVRFSIKEADRLGLEATFHNSLGWSSSGGPWIKPEKSMQKLVWSETVVEGGKSIQINLSQPKVDPRWNYYKDIAVLAICPDASGIVSQNKVLDISNLLLEDGSIKWSAPNGKWKIIRYGHTTTGKLPVQAPLDVAGLECDKMDRGALRIHFEQYPGKILREAGALAGKSLKYIAVDSYEAGLQNWNPQFRDQFIKRRGYDPILWLPVITGTQVDNFDPRNKSASPGIIIDNQEISERFLYDFERTISELYMEEYYAAMGQMVHQYPGVKLEVQSYNAPFNLVENAVKNEMPAGEFWHANKNYGWWTLSLAASAAHIAGNKIVSAESFTAEPQRGNWSMGPEDLKAEADLAFSKGITRMELHIQPHQPWRENAIPGLIGGSYGLQINPANTFWKQSLSWNKYLARCQYMLRQGQFIADICYLYPKRQRGFTVPEGYNGDAIDEQSLIKWMYVKDGKLCLPGGMQYRILVLPNTTIMTLALAEKIKELVKDGALIIGTKPLRAPGLENFPKQDKQVYAIGETLWGTKDGRLHKVNRFGKGIVYVGVKPEEVLGDLKIEKDLEVTQSINPSNIVWIHRKTEQEEIYFVANQEKKSLNLSIRFRVKDKMPEIWNPETGEIVKALKWKQQDGCTIVNISFNSLASRFIVFKKTSGKNILLEKKEDNVKPFSTIDLSKDWFVDFYGVQQTPPKFLLNSLTSWPDLNNIQIKYFSGTATYTKKYLISADQLGRAEKILLDLGAVNNFADVFINGKEIANLWKSPFLTDITTFLQAGENELKVHVTNLWANRMIGDEQEPSDMEWTKESFSSDSSYRGRELVRYPDWFLHGKQRPSKGRFTFSTWNYYRKDDPLLPSGLIGPVSLKMYNRQ